MSQPHNRACAAPQPGEIDEDLGEFWVTDPWSINLSHNLSSFERNRFYLNTQGETFVEASYISGADSDGDGRCVVPLDYDNDGMQDLLVRQVGGGPLKLYRNQLPPQNYLRVRLEGTKSNRLGIGSRLVAHVGDQQIVRELYPHNSFRSQMANEVHFGLRGVETLDRLTVTWPSGQVDEWVDLPTNQSIVLTEGRTDSVEPALR